MSLTLRQKLRLPSDASDELVIAECRRFYQIYEYIIKTSSSTEVADLARKKKQSLTEAAKNEGYEIENAFLYEAYSPGDSVISIEAELDGYNNNKAMSEAEYQVLKGKINALPDSAGKYYLLAELTYSFDGVTIDSVNDITTNLKKANELDTSNPVYIELLKIINRQLDSYKHSKDEHLNTVKKKAIIKKILKYIAIGFKGLGRGIVYVGMAILALLALIIGAILEGC